MDALSQLFQVTGLSANLFFSGSLCSISAYPADLGHGHLHLLRAGQLRFTAPGHRDLLLKEPTVLLLPRSIKHQLMPLDKEGVDLVCGAIDLGLAESSPLHRALPDILALPIKRLPAVASALDLLFAETAQDLPGRQAALDRLLEFLLIQLLRVLQQQGELGSGLLAGLADARLAKPLTALHQNPTQGWTLAQLADLAAMSRARFAAHFLAVMGQTAMDYLTDWRITLAQKRLLQGQAVKTVAAAVGYQSSAAFIRAFSRRVGEAPAGWTARRRLLR